MMDYSKHTVLIVDDEIEILKALKRGLHNEPYKLVFASSGKQAIESFYEEESISVVITDMKMPGMNGLELLKSIDEISPRTVKIVLTGYTQLPQILATINTVEIFKFITKPWDLETELKVYIKEAIDRFDEEVDESSRLETQEKKGVLYNKMLLDSYEKVDYLLRLYEELMKALNQHHLFTVQSLRLLDSTEEIPQIILQMNNRVHYLNKIFEMSRYPLRAFEISELKDNIEKTLIKIAADVDYVTLKTQNSDRIYYDNFKMFSSLLIDLIEFLQFNGAGILSVKLAMHDTKLPEIDLLQVKIESELSERLNRSLLYYSKFVEVIIKIIGGRFNRIENKNIVTMELFLQIARKPDITEKQTES